MDEFEEVAIPKVTSEKPAIPTLWMDTSVVIKLAKIARGEALHRIEVERLSRLKTLVQKLVGNGKLLCPEADQEEEYAAGRLDREVHGEFAALSLGISLKHRQGIFDFQVYYGMKAHVHGAEAINLPVSVYFHSDPIRELEDARKRDFVITVGPFKDPELLARRATAKAEVAKQWEELRQEFVAQGRKYKDQLKEEQRGYADAMMQMVEQFKRRMYSRVADFWDIMGVEGFLAYKIYWRELGGQPADWEGVYRFFCSTYFYNLPIARIRNQLGAELLTGTHPIASGDRMDVELLSVAVPVAHYVLADRSMSLRIKQLGIDKDWNAEVYSMSDIDGLFERLERLS